jgi:hypothetical protein
MIKKALIFSLFISLLVDYNSYAGTMSQFPEIPGWKLKVDDRVYNSGDLWELINGAADIFLSYYFEDLHIGEYTKKNQMIRVELYRHKTVDDAYGIYTAERMPDYPLVSVGAQGYKSQGVLNFTAGNYYVKIMSAGIDEADEISIASTAEKIDASLMQPKLMPDILNLFPEEGKVMLSDSYIAQNFMGYTFFHHAFTAKYENPADFQLFIIRLPPEEIQKMVDQYIAMMKEDKVTRSNELIIVNDLFNGTVFLNQTNNILVGVVNTQDEEIARSYISKVYEKLK